MIFFGESRLGDFIFWRFGLFLFCLFWQAFLFFGQAAHHRFVFGYSQRSGDGIFGGGANIFSLGMPRVHLKIPVVATPPFENKRY